MSKTPRYHSFLLRIWWPGHEGCCNWRASLEWPDTRERRGFATLEDLFDFLRNQTVALPQQRGVGPGDKAASGGRQETTTAGVRKENERQ